MKYIHIVGEWMEAPSIPLTITLILSLILRSCDCVGGQLACGNGGSGLRKAEKLKNKGSALFSSGVEVTAGNGKDVLTPFRAEFKFWIKPADPLKCSLRK